MNFVISVLLIIAATVIYSCYIVFQDGNDGFDAMPRRVRWIYLLGYVITFVYVTNLLLQWGLFVPGLIKWILNLVLYLLDWKLLSLLFQIISDLTYLPVLVMILYMPCMFPEYKSDARFTYIFRIVMLACMIPVHIYTINFFETGDAVDWLDRIIYDAGLAFAIYLTFTSATEDYHENTRGQQKKGIMYHLETFWKKIWKK